VQLRSLWVVGWNSGRVVLLLKVHQLRITLTPELVTCHAGPFESDLVEEVDAGLGHVRRLAFSQKLELLFLGTNPGTKLFVIIVLLGDVAVSVSGMEAFEFLL
jgi:hypothetical protein